MSWSIKNGIWLRRLDKHYIDFVVPQEVYYLEKSDELSESVAFGQKLSYFTDQDGPKGGAQENEF